MQIGDLVRCKYFHTIGIVASRPEYWPNDGTSNVDKVVKVYWAHGAYSKYKTQYLEVINGSR